MEGVAAAVLVHHHQQPQQQSGQTWSCFPGEIFQHTLREGCCADFSLHIITAGVRLYFCACVCVLKERSAESPVNFLFWALFYILPCESLAGAKWDKDIFEEDHWLRFEWLTGQSWI